MSREHVNIRGTSEGVIITIGPGDWQTRVAELKLKLGQKASFFKGGRVALDVGLHLLDQSEIEAVGNLLLNHQMTLWAIQGEAPDTQLAAEGLGLETKLSITPTVKPALPRPVPSQVDTTTLTVKRTLRSGQSVEHTGHIVIIGDVNPGAKVMAGGHIIVWGRLRGTAQAGAIEAKNAFVCALQLSPMQLIIGNVISRSPSSGTPDAIFPEMALVQDGQIVAEPWR